MPTSPTNAITPPGTTAVSTSALTKHFGRVVAVDQLDLDVVVGEVFGFLGPNGAGKTTTIRLLLDVIRPTSGSCSVLGAAPGDPMNRRRIGYLPAELSIPPHYTARDVVAFFSGVRGIHDERLFRELLDRFALDPDRPMRELSTGNRRKVGLIQAFVHRPDLLVLDEPTSGLDPLLQHQFADLVRSAVAEGATVLLSSHVLPEVEALADRIGILRRGRLVATARPDELLSRARQRLRLTLVAPLEDSDAVFAGVPGVVATTRRGDGTIDVIVEGPVGPALKAAGALDVVRIVAGDEDLEQVFLGFYREEES